MVWLVAGLILWCCLHLMPSLARGLRTNLIESFGDKRYRITFAIAIFISVVLMIIGWRSAGQWAVYEPPTWGRPVGVVLILIAFLLFGYAHAKTNVKRYVRHPQLTGLILWATGHLLANGDNLSLILFGTLGLWALTEIFLISNREGPWQKPEPVPLTAEWRPLLIGLIIFSVFFFAHPYLIGVSPIPQ